MNIEPIKLPYSVAKILKQQYRLMTDTLLPSAIGRQLTLDSQNRYADYLHYKLGASMVPVSFYARVLDSLRNRVITREDWVCILRRIVALAEAYRQNPEAGERLPAEWALQTESEWVPCHVHSVEAMKSGADRYWLLHCRVIGGSPAEVVFDYRVSQKMAFRLAWHSGFRPYPEVKRLYDPMQFAQLRVLLKIRKGSNRDRISIENVGEHLPLSTYNRKINKARNPETRACPENQRIMCYACKFGRDRCRFAVLEHTKITTDHNETNESI